MTPEIEDVLRRAPFCHVGTRTPWGPHVTPLAFALSGGRVWATTARSSAKARAWRTDPRIGALARDGDDVVTFTGRARTFDALDPLTWIDAVRETPALALATARFAQRNARFFAGYAMDAKRVPFAWMPPGRLLVELSIEGATRWTAEAVGRTPRTVIPSRDRFRVTQAEIDVLGALPNEVAGALGRDGPGQLGLEIDTGIAVLPVRWAALDAGLVAVVAEAVLSSARPSAPTFPVALGVDRPTWWRAGHMVGAMVQGTGETIVPRRLRSGRRSAAEVVAAVGGHADRDVLIRIRPARVIWWQGWSSGSRRLEGARSRRG
jgi:hypothetical protein